MENTNKKNHTLRNILLIGVLGILGACAFLIIIGVAFQVGQVSATPAPLAAIPTLGPVATEAANVLPEYIPPTARPAATQVPVSNRLDTAKEAAYLLAELNATEDYQATLNDLAALFKLASQDPYITSSSPVLTNILVKSADLVDAARRMAQEPIPSPKYARVHEIMGSIYADTIDYETHIRAGIKTMDVDQIRQATDAITRISSLAQQADDEINRLK